MQERIYAWQQANEPIIPEFDPTVDGLDETIFSISLRGFPDLVADIEDPSVYSIQQSKLRTEEDARMKLAEEKKQGIRRRITDLRYQFEELVKENTQ